jgi:general secretion pathway protein L
MPTSPTDPAESGAALRLADGRALIVVPGGGTALAVLGTEVAIHWLDLAGDLTLAQAAAAARLILADASAEPLAGLHFAAGRPENGLTPVALAPVERMRAWLEDDPDLVLPETLLLLPPAAGLVRRGLDHRGLAAAFSVEPELAELVIGDAIVEEVSEEAFEAGLAAALADPVLNLRQGPFARRRQWKVDRRNLRRMGLLAAALALVSLVLQIATILRYRFDADRLEAEAAALGPPATARSRPGFGALAPLLFEAVRSTPNLELTRLEYRPDGSLGATVSVDSPATLAAFRARAEASGLSVEGGNFTGAGGQPIAELVLRPA